MPNERKLITEVQKRPTLWDAKHYLYRSTSLKQSLWEEVAAECNLTSNVAKYRWNLLRQSFKGYYKKMKKGSKDEASEDIKWVWYKHLLFLVDSFEYLEKNQHIPAVVKKLEKSVTSNLENAEQESNLLRISTSGMPTSTCNLKQNIANELEPKKNMLIETGISKPGIDLSNIDIERLIAEVRHRQPLWNVMHPLYKHWYQTNKQWNEVAAACNVITDIAKLKWTALWNDFRVYHREMKEQSRDAQSVEDQWIWYKHLQFLVDSSGCITNHPSNVEDSEQGTNLPMEIASGKRSCEDNNTSELKLQAKRKEKNVESLNVDIEKLITAVRKHQVLWDTSHPQFRNAYFTRQLWAKVATECDIGINVAKYKWYGLTSTLGKIQRKIERRAKNSESTEVPWIWYKHLQFIAARKQNCEHNSISELDLQEKRKKKRGLFNTGVEKLITVVRKYPAIWDASHPQHRSLNATKKLWVKVAAECDIDVNDARHRWAELRNSFRKNHRKVEQTFRNADTVRWIWYKQLLFLLDSSKRTDVIDVDDLASSNSEDSGQGTDMPEVSTSDTVTPATVSSRKQSNEEPIIIDLETEKNQPATRPPSPPAQLPSFANAIGPTPPASNINAHHMSKESEDDLERYLVSLHKPMSQLSTRKQMLLRIKFQKLLYQFIYDSDE